MSHLLYFVSIIVFTGPVVLNQWKRNKKILQEYELILFVILVASIPFTAVEYFALKWHAWVYYPSQTLNLQIGAQFETYIFALAVTFVVSVATLGYAARADKKQASQRRTLEAAKKAAKR